MLLHRISPCLFAVVPYKDSPYAAQNLIAYSAARDFEDTIVRAKVLSYISMTVSVSPIIAPVIGALIFHHFGWQANFIVMAIVACILLIQTKLSLLESPFWTPPQERFSVKKYSRNISPYSIYPLYGAHHLF